MTGITTPICGPICGPVVGPILRSLSLTRAKRAKALQTFWAALHNQSSDPVDVLFVGDSFIEQVGATTITKGVVNTFRDYLRTLRPTPGVTGGFGSKARNFSWSPSGEFVTSTGAAVNNNYGVGLRAWQKTATGEKITATIEATGFDIIYTKNTSTGTLYYKVDGGTSTTVSTSGASLSPGQSIQIRGLSAGSHTIEVGWSSGGAVVIENLMIYNGDESSGIRVWNGGKGAQQTANFVNASNWYSSITMQPSLVVICMGVNNWAGSSYTPISSADTKTQMLSIIESIRAKCTIPPSFVLCLQYAKQGTGLDNQIEPWANYVQVLREIAAADDAIVNYDLASIFGAVPVVGSAASGALVTDNVHPNDAGHTLWGESLARFVAPT